MSFHLGVSRDLMGQDGEVDLDALGLDGLRRTAIEWDVLREDVAELRPEDIRDYDGLLLETPRLSATSLIGIDRLVIVARFGVGFDTIDIEACTASGVIVTITPDGVRRPVAVGAVTLVLALSQWLLAKDRLTRAGRWDARGEYMGVGLEGRTVGLVGMGNVGMEFMRLIEPFGMRRLACDPYVDSSSAATADIELVDLDVLLPESDFVVIVCSLTDETRGLVGAEQLATMKTSAFLVNVARGPVVDQKALTEALQQKRIAGAGLDVFEHEPVELDDPLLDLENVILSAHSICWTDHCFADCGRSALRSILSVAEGQMPSYVVDPAVLESALVQRRLARFRS